MQTSLKPTTAAIPHQHATLCIECLQNFRKHRLMCDECEFVPGQDAQYVTHCSRCFEGVITKH